MRVTAYTDGSYKECKDAMQASVGVYGSGLVLQVEGHDDVIKWRNADSNPIIAKHHQIGGELGAVMMAVQFIKPLETVDTLHIVYDFLGVENWVTGEWKIDPDTKIAFIYRDMMRALQQQITVTFEHVYSHTGHVFNEMADHLAKEAIEEYARLI